MPTIKEVKEIFEKELQAIFLLDQTLGAERAALTDKAFAAGRDLTPEEVARRREIAATRMELGEAMETLALETVNRLENASDVDRLISKIEAVNQQLQDDLDRLRHFEETAAKAAAVAAGIASIVTGLVGFKASLARPG